MRPGLFSLTIQTKIILILLLVSLGSIAVIAYLGYASGEVALKESIRRQLLSVRSVKRTQLMNRLTNIRDEVITISSAEGFVNGTKALRAAFQDLKKAEIPPEWDAEIKSFYQKQFIPELAKTVEGSPVAEIYLPRTPAAKSLQYHYLAKNPAPYGEKGRDYDYADPGPYGVAHKKYHKLMHTIIDRFGFDDAYIIDPDTGEVIYSSEKAVDLGTNLNDGPFADTNLAELYQVMRHQKDRDSYQFTDFARYRPHLNKPSAFVASPVFDSTQMVGLLVLNFPVEKVDRLLTGDYQWGREGLGETGETYLVGSDHFMRSRSRFMFEDPKGTLELMRRLGKPASMIRRIEQTGMLILNLPVRSEPVELALGGKEGIMEAINYRNAQVISAYAPVDVEGVRWAIVSEMERAEAMSPIGAYARDVLRTSVAIILGVTLLSIGLSHWLVRPLRGLSSGARRVSAGDVDFQIKVGARDEFGELAEAFNGMVRSLKEKTEQLGQQVHENEELLLNILPGPVAARMREGEGPISDSFADVTILYADIIGFTELIESQSAEDGLALLNDLVIAFDDAADRHGVEKVKTFGSGYMAVCGLSFERPDHTSRVVEFAQEMLRIVNRLNKERGTELSLAVGVNAGPVVAGVVGRSKFVYDLWGDTVTLARRAQEAQTAKSHVIRVTANVYTRLKDAYTFEANGQVWTLGA